MSKTKVRISETKFRSFYKTLGQIQASESVDLNDVNSDKKQSSIKSENKKPNELVLLSIPP